MSVAVPRSAREFRFSRLDALRGIAMLWMAIYHFAYDLDWFGVIRQDIFHDPVWTVQRTCILSMFLFSAGVGLAIARHQQQPWHRFWRRWRQIAAGALLVSIASWWMFPDSFIFFGVLHGIAVMLILTRLAGAAAGQRWLWSGGALLLVLPWLFSHTFFDSRWTAWVGLVTHKPRTEDFVPLLPWMGVMCWGMAAGLWMLARRPDWLTGPLPDSAATARKALRALTWLGQRSLSFYLLHQPVLIGLLMGLRWMGAI